MEVANLLLLSLAECEFSSLYERVHERDHVIEALVAAAKPLAVQRVDLCKRVVLELQDDLLSLFDQSDRHPETLLCLLVSSVLNLQLTRLEHCERWLTHEVSEGHLAANKYRMLSAAITVCESVASTISKYQLACRFRDTDKILDLLVGHLVVIPNVWHD